MGSGPPSRGGRPAGSGTADPFAALADPTRRLLLERLAGGEKSAGELTQGLAMSPAAVSQHLRVLRDTGLVGVRADGRHRRYQLRREPFAELRDWLEHLDRFWHSRADALGRHLDSEAAGDRQSGTSGHPGRHPDTDEHPDPAQEEAPA